MADLDRQAVNNLLALNNTQLLNQVMAPQVRAALRIVKAAQHVVARDDGDGRGGLG